MSTSFESFDMSHPLCSGCPVAARYADVILRESFPERFADLVAALTSYRPTLDELRAGGGAPSRVPPSRHFTRAEIPPSVRRRFSMSAMSKPLRGEAGAPFVRPWAFRLTPEMSKAPGHPRGYSRARGGS